MDKRRTNLRKYGISKARYDELRGFCEQYPEWKKELESEAYISSPQYKMSPGNPNKGTTDMTGTTAVRLVRFREYIDMIEKCAKEADADFWNRIIASVCYGASPKYLIAYYSLPISERAFYDRRRYFFYLLDKAKM